VNVLCISLLEVLKDHNLTCEEIVIGLSEGDIANCRATAAVAPDAAAGGKQLLPCELTVLCKSNAAYFAETRHFSWLFDEKVLNS